MMNQSEQLIDEILVMDCQTGSAKALEMLVSRWQKRLWRHAHRLVGDTEAAWDVTQQSWLAVIKGLRKLHDPANFKAWAYKITTNKSIDWIKKSKAANRVSIHDIPDPPQQEEKDAGLKDLLQKLDTGKRAVLSLYYFEQLSIPEISLTLNIPKGTVKSRLHTAREEVRKLWREHLET